MGFSPLEPKHHGAGFSEDHWGIETHPRCSCPVSDITSQKKWSPNWFSFSVLLTIIYQSKENRPIGKETFGRFLLPSQSFVGVGKKKLSMSASIRVKFSRRLLTAPLVVNVSYGSTRIHFLLFRSPPCCFAARAISRFNIRKWKKKFFQFGKGWKWSCLLPITKHEPSLRQTF